MAIGLLLGCQAPIEVPPAYQPTDAHDAYRYGLEQAGLADTKLAQAWMHAGDQCLENPTHIRLPYKEAFYFDDLQPVAYAYQFKTKKGQIVQVALSYLDTTAAQVFIDGFYLKDDTCFTHIASIDSSMRYME